MYLVSVGATRAARRMVSAQDTFYWDLNLPQTPHWLGPEMAEQLRASVDARLTLDAEYMQVRPPAHVLCSVLCRRRACAPSQARISSSRRIGCQEQRHSISELA